MQTVVDDISVKVNVEMPQEEIVTYIKRAKQMYQGKHLSEINICVDGEEVDLEYKFLPVSFERTRRITGYLVGTMDRWNNAKKAEEKDRVKHL